MLGRRYRVLVVEDDDSAAFVARTELELNTDYEFVVERAISRHSALNIVRSQRDIDAVLLDLDLPDATQDETLHELVAHVPEVAVVALTNAEKAVAFELLRCGASDFVTKQQAAAGVLGDAIAFAVERKTFEHGLRTLADTDPLTGIGNRRRLSRAHASLSARLRRKGGTMVVGVLDLDRFKVLNDTQGHEAGDRALVQVAQSLTHVLRGEDLPVRTGGDEFAFVLLDESSVSLAPIIERIHREVTDGLQAVATGFSVSLGAVATTEPMKLDDLLQAADSVQYDVKRNREGSFEALHMMDDRPISTA